MDAPINEKVVVRSAGPKPQETPQIHLVSVHVRDFLNMRRLQGRLSVRQTAALLNCGEHDIPVLVSRGLLTPLGHPPSSAQKYFGPTEVLEMAGDPERMGQICFVKMRFPFGLSVPRQRSYASEFKNHFMHGNCFSCNCVV